MADSSDDKRDTEADKQRRRELGDRVKAENEKKYGSGGKK